MAPIGIPISARRRFGIWADRVRVCGQASEPQWNVLAFADVCLLPEGHPVPEVLVVLGCFELVVLVVLLVFGCLWLG